MSQAKSRAGSRALQDFADHILNESCTTVTNTAAKTAVQLVFGKANLVCVYGAGCMGLGVWGWVYGAVCMGLGVWGWMYGAGCMGLGVWGWMYGAGCM